jgi:PKHD-type hydroxylase
MNYLTHQLLNAEEINFIEKELEQENQSWEDGKKTAGTHASKVKNNLQLNRKSDASKKLSSLIKQKILNNHLIKSFTLPKNIHGIMFTKSSRGMSYGRHIDNAYMSSGRADLSFTVFLTQKNQYEGGELLIENITSEKNLNLIVEKF